VLCSALAAAAVLDRLLHQSIMISIRDDSSRLRDKLKAGVLKLYEAEWASMSDRLTCGP
jgi:hypothetical protein